MADQTLLTIRRNQVFETLQAAELDPALFHWEEVHSHGAHGPTAVSRLVLTDHPDFFYQFDYNKDGGEWGRYSPGGSKRLENANLGSWKLQVNYLFDWAERLREELHARDLWAELAVYSEQALSPPLLPGDEQAISVDEAASIRDAADRLKHRLSETYELSDEQFAFIEGRLDYLAESARSQTKMAWVHGALGVFMTIAWAISPDDVPYYWDIIKSAFQTVVFLIGPGG